MNFEYDLNIMMGSETFRNLVSIHRDRMAKTAEEKEIQEIEAMAAIQDLEDEIRSNPQILKAAKTIQEHILNQTVVNLSSSITNLFMHLNLETV